MKKLLLSVGLAGSLIACTSNENTQLIRDNETPVTAGDKTDDHQAPKDTIVLTDSISNPEIGN